MQTHFDDIFKIKIHEITLREILTIQSIFAANTQKDLSDLVQEQPGPQIFFKVFLELGVKSMLPYLAFDSKVIKLLLRRKNKAFFNDEFPLFYKNA